MNLVTRNVVSFASLAAALAGQNHESRGPLAGAATAVGIDAPAGGSTSVDARARLHANGFTLAALQPAPPGSAVPDLGTILQNVGAPTDLDVDDWSTGRDDVMFDAFGNSDVPIESWVVLSFSLRNASGTTLPGVAGSRIRREAMLGPIGASLFSWIQDGDDLPDEWVDEVERSHSRQELGVTSTTADVDAIDFAAVLGANQATWIGSEPDWNLFGGRPDAVFFTVTHATRGNVPTSWWGSLPPSGATILVTSRLVTGGWSVPSVYKYFFEIGLTQNDDIDGLAVDVARSSILFSLRGTSPTTNQFMTVYHGTDGTPTPAVAKKPGGQPVSDAVGAAGSDDVDAICTLDPRIGTTTFPTPPDDFGNSCGTPRDGVLGVPSVHASAYRRYTGGPDTTFDTFLVGWPPLTGVGPGAAALFVQIDDVPVLYPVGGIKLRDTTPAVPGDPQHEVLHVPDAAVLQSIQVTFRWVAVDAAFTELAEAWPVLVFP
jgi:hypothetical protein